MKSNQVLEYMTAELVEAAGLQAKKAKVRNKKQGVLMISPTHIVQAVGRLFVWVEKSLVHKDHLCIGW